VRFRGDRDRRMRWYFDGESNASLPSKGIPATTGVNAKSKSYRRNDTLFSLAGILIP